MGADGLVGNAHSHPYHGLAARPATHHLHDPCFIRVADSKRFAFTVITIFLGQARHHLNGFAGGAGALQPKIHERSIVNQACSVNHLMPAAKGCLGNGNLELVNVSYHIVSHRGLWYLPMIFICVPVVYLAHLSLGMVACRIMAKILEHTIIIGTV